MKRLNTKKLPAMLKIGDFVTVGLALMLAVYFIIGAGSSSGRPKRLMLVNGESLVPLKWENATYSIFDMTGKKMIIQIENDKGRARVLSSDCPDKLCVHSGWVSDCGHIAACLPNGIALMVDCKGSLNVTEPE